MLENGTFSYKVDIRSLPFPPFSLFTLDPPPSLVHMRFSFPAASVFLACTLTTLVEKGKAADVPPEQRHPNSCYGNNIAMTFDDGPTNLTRLVVDELVKYGQKATFFRNVNNYSESERSKF